MVQFDGNPSSGDGNILLVKGGGTRSDVETFEVRNGDGTTFVVRGDGTAEFAGVTTATQLFEGTTRVATSGKAIAMALIFG